MSAGAIVAGQCVESSAAVDVYFSSVAPGVTAGNPEFITQLENTISGWYAVTYSGGSVVNSSLLTAPTFYACDTTESFFDGLQLGWLVAAVMVAAYGVHLLRRALL